LVLGKDNSYLVSGNDTLVDTDVYEETLDRAETAEQELGSLIKDLRRYAQHLRNGDFDEVTGESVADSIEEIINGN
jgi:hypothetical protein